MQPLNTVKFFLIVTKPELNINFMTIRVLAIFSLSMFLMSSSCKKDDNNSEIEIRDRTEQYNNVERDSIETYMKTHYYTLDAQYNVTIDTIDPAGSHTSLWDDPGLETLQVNDPEVDDLVYDLYYIPFRAGDHKAIHKMDRVLVAYKGFLLNNKVFDEKIDNMPIWLDLNYSIKAWQEVLPYFNDGTFSDNGDGTFTFTGYGAGMLITPSGLAYYHVAANKIPAYSPLVFSFKSFVVDDDLDNDTVKNIDEDVNGNGDPQDDDTDNDGIKNINDKDDDGDGVLTKDEDANGDGDPTNDDTDGDGTPDYLDADTH